MLARTVLAKAIQSHTLGGTVRMAENQLTTYVAALVASSRVTSSVRDPFIVRKFHQKIYNLVKAYHEFITGPASPSLGGPAVLQQQHLLSCADALIDLVEYEEHLKRSDVVVLAYAQRALLRFRLFIQRMKIQATSQIKPAFAAKEAEIKKHHLILLPKSLDNKLEIEGKYAKHIEQLDSIHSRQKDALISTVKLFLKLTKKRMKNLQKFK